MDNGRRKLLYSEDVVRRIFAEMRQQLHDMADRHDAEVAALRREVDQVRADYIELRDAVLMRQHAEAEISELYRERDIARARAAERDPNAALN